MMLGLLGLGTLASLIGLLCLIVEHDRNIRALERRAVDHRSIIAGLQHRIEMLEGDIRHRARP